MKISVHYDKEDGHIYHVKSFDSYIRSGKEKFKTEDDVIKATEECNKRSGYEAFKTFDVSCELGEVITFLLGEKGYRAYADIDNLDDSVNELSASINSMYSTAYDLNEEAERITRMFKELKGLFEKIKDDGKVA